MFPLRAELRSVPFTIALATSLFTGVELASTQSQKPADWVGDVGLLLAAMDSIHPAPYRIHGREEWGAAATALERQLPSLRYHKAVAGFTRLVALAADGHTRLANVRLQEHTRVTLDLLPGEGFETLYPVRFEVFSDGLYAVQAIDEYTGLFGKRIVAINGRRTEEVVDALRPYVPADNEMWVIHVVPQYLRSPAVLHAAGVTPRLDAPLVLTLEDEREQRFDIALSPVAVESEIEWIDLDRHLGTTSPLPLYRRFSDHYQFVYLDDSRTVYVRFRQVQNERDEPLDRFAARLLQFVDSAEVERLILDVRRNGGGNNYLNQPLVHGLIKSEKINQPGRLFVIADRGTFSAAMSFVGDVERNTYALFVGEPTGAPVNMYGDSRRVTLPASGLTVRISALHWQHSDPRDVRPWIVPDIPAPLSFADFVAHRDPALEAIFAYQHPADARTLTPNRNWRRPSQRRDPRPVVRW